MTDVTAADFEVPPVTPGVARLQVWAQEAAFVVAAYSLYAWVRDRVGSATDSQAVATAHGEAVIGLERAVGLNIEHAVQHVTLRSPWLMRSLDSFWSYGYLAVTLATIVWLAARHLDDFPNLRTAFFLATFAAVAVFALYPTAPPRLLPAGYGVVDAWQSVGGIGASQPPRIETISDMYASLPSLHVAWSMWCAFAVRRGSRRTWLRRVVWLYPLLTVFAVVATGNHFVLDCIAGALLMTAFVAVTPRLMGCAGSRR